jgi:hypothetical protein
MVQWPSVVLRFCQDQEHTQVVEFKEHTSTFVLNSQEHSTQLPYLEQCLLLAFDTELSLFFLFLPSTSE